MSPALFVCRALLALALCATPTLASELSVSAGLDATQVRDRHVSPLRYGGAAWRLGVGLDADDDDWIDRIRFTGHGGGLAASDIPTMGEIERWGIELDWRLERAVWRTAHGELLVGGAWRTGLAIREGIATGWDMRSVLEPAASWRVTWPALSLVAGLRTPLIGGLRRPGYASLLDGRDLEFGDTRLAAPHTLQGVTASVSGAWRREGRGLRVDLAWRYERIPLPQTVEASSVTADVVLEWSL